MADATCLHCGTDVPPKGRTGPRASYCARVCRDAAARERAAAAYAQQKGQINSRKREAQRALLEATVKVCPQCSKTFGPARTMKQRFCSDLCGRRFVRTHNSKPCSIEGCDGVHRARGLCMKHYNEIHGADRSRKGLPETRRKNLRVKTQRRRALTTDPEADKVDRDVVGDRDHWKCGVCRKRVDNSIPYPQPTSPSLDHVIPLSQGGSHTYANCRITHLGCNLQRSNKGGNEQLMLIG